MSEAEERTRLIRHWLMRAEESLASATDELAARRYLIAINRVYYALFYAASAALLAEGYQFAKHAGVRSGVNQHLVQTGKLAPEMGQLYNEMFDERHDADYEPFFDVSAEVARERLQQGRAFLQRIRELLQSA